METQITALLSKIESVRTRPGFKRFSRVFMVVCCTLPITAILIIPRIGIALSNGAWIAIVLFCPISHFAMMRPMHSKDDKD